MNKSTLVGIITSIILLLLAVFQGKQGINKDAEIATLQSKLITSNGAPAMVSATDNVVKIVYKDRVITRYLPTEGKVVYDTARLQQAYSLIDSLRGVADASGHPDTVFAHGDSLEPLHSAPLAAIDTVKINAMIDSLLWVISHPSESGILTIKTWGTCLRPSIGVGFNGQIDAIVNAKLFFWDRYGLGVGTTSHQFGVTVTRHVDDWIPFLRNTELIGMVGIPFKKENTGMFAGIAVGL